MAVHLKPFSFEGMFRAVELVKERLLRAVALLEAARVPYAIVGGHAVAAWVERIDPAAIRNTPDVDVLVKRADFLRVVEALEKGGFVHRHAAGVDMFLDGPQGRPRDAVHVLFAGERVRREDEVPSPDLSEAQRGDRFDVISLEGLVRMKLTAWRDKDRTHLRDMIEVGLIDQSWLEALTPGLAERLRMLLDTPGS